MQSPAPACPVCSRMIEEHTGWAVRRAGQWLRFRSRECLDEFERHPEAYAAVEGGERRPDESPCTEWANY